MSINPINGASSTLRAPLLISGGVLSVQSGHGSRFNIPSGDHIYLTVADNTGFEIVRFDSVGPIAGDNIPITRSQDGTGARAFPIGSTVRAAWNIAQLAEYVVEIATALVPPASDSPAYFGAGAPPGALIPGYPLYYNTTTGIFYAWNGSNYIPLTQNPEEFSSSGSGAPSGGTPGVLYFETDEGILYVKIGGVWVPTSVSDSSFSEDSGVPGGGTPGFFYRDTNTDIIYVNIGGTWYPTQLPAILPDIYGSPQEIEVGESFTLDEQGRVTSHSSGVEFLIRSAAPGAAVQVPVIVAYPGIAGPQPTLPNVDGIFGTILTAQGTAAIRVTPPVGKKAYVKFTANMSIIPAAPLGAARVALLAIKTSAGLYIEPDPVAATNTPAQSILGPAGSTAPFFLCVESQIIEIAAQTDFICEIAAETLEYNVNKTGTYGAVTFGAELKYVR